MSITAQTAEQYYESWVPPPDKPLTAADKQMRNTGTLSPRICDLPGFVKPNICEAIVAALAEDAPAKERSQAEIEADWAERDALAAEARATRIATVSKYKGDQLARAKWIEAVRMPELLRLRDQFRAEWLASKL
jgi:hypothetical protein